MKKALQTLIFSFFVLFSYAQTSTPPRLLQVYIDRFSPPQNLNDLQMEFPYINYTAQPTEADVHVVVIYDGISNQQSRTGLCFFGSGRFMGQNDTIWYTIAPLTVGLEYRDKINEAFRRGIYPYLEQCAFNGDLYALIGEKPQPIEDLSWHKTQYWLQTLGSINNAKSSIISNYRGLPLQSEKIISHSFDLNANVLHFERFWRYSGNIAAFDYYSNKSTAMDTIFSEAKYKVKNLKSNIEAVKTMTNHIAIGANLYLAKQSGDIKNFNQEIAFGAEYNLFPYANFFRKRMLLGYKLGLTHSKIGLQLPLSSPLRHRFFAEYYTQKRWGYFGMNAEINTRFNTKTFLTFDNYLETHTGFHLRKNLFFTLYGQVKRDNLFDLSKFDYAKGIFVNKSRHTIIHSKIGLTYLFGSGVRNRLPLGLDKLLNEDFFSFDAPKVDEGWNRWSFIGDLSGDFRREKFKSQLPNVGKLISLDGQYTVTGGIQANKVKRKVRHTTAIELGIFKEEYKKYDSNLEKNAEIEAHFFQNLVFTFWDRLSLGGMFDYNSKHELFRYPFAPLPTFILKDKLKIYGGLEINLIPYTHYLRKRLSFGYYHLFDESPYIYRYQDYIEEDLLFLSTFHLKPWGYWSGSFNHFSNLKNQPWVGYKINAQLEIGYKISKSFYLTLAPQITTEHIPNYSNYFNPSGIYVVSAHLKSQDFNCRAGIHYYFGQGKSNVINPSMIRF
jgi:hypothetical protein